ncbi:MAG: ATP-binding protein [Bryobacteraceae bacterium]|nr:ATP-binding protein [Bryobacteraceae bacterium]
MPGAVSDARTMAERIAGLDWSLTAVGPRAEWPEALRAAVQLMINSRFPMFLWWGPELVNIYNDAYIPVLGKRHPEALGKNARETWHEIWDTIGPQADAVLRERKSTWNDEVLLVMERYGYAEETYFTWSYSPILGTKGSVAGLFCACVEDTAKVLSRRRLKTLRELAAETSERKTAQEAIGAAAEVLGRNLHDLPFALIYELDNEGKRARLAGKFGVADGDRGAPEEIGLASTANPWELDLAAVHEGAVVDLERCFDRVPPGPWPDGPREALVLSLERRGEATPAGVLIAGVNRYRTLDEDYRGFLGLVAGHIATALANARAYESERRRAEALAEIDRAKTLFFSNVSHEFRTPLTLMLGPLEDLRASGGESEDTRGQLDLIYRNCLRLLKLVNTLLDFSRIEAGRARSSYSATDLAAFTRDVASSFRSAMERSGLRYEVDCDPLPQPAWVDREMWEKIVLNLLSNAFKFTLKGSVRLRLVEQEGKAVLTVTDTGAGIAPEHLPHLFERFHRVRETHGRTDEGTGIGLALVRELVHLHGGTVAVTSEPGRGSTFTVELPLAPPGEAKREAKVDRGAVRQADAFVEEALRWVDGETGGVAGAAAAEAGHLLVADDNADMREYLARLLGTRYRVTIAADGEQALAAVRADPPDLILTDVMMPVMDGFALVSEVRARPELHAVPIIMLSARSGEESLIEGLDAGADDYLMKPFTARELLARVGAHLTLRRERQRAHERLVQAFEQAPVGIVVLRGADYVVELANPIFREMLEGRELVGRKFADIVPELEEEAWKALRLVTEQGIPFTASEFHVPYDRDRDGQREDHWFNVNYQPIREADGSVSGMIGVVAEVTPNVLARKELERANAELEEFAYVASHDLREPLRMVNIYTQMLLQLPAIGRNPQAQQYSEFVESGVSRMDQLIKDLLMYSRVVHSEQETARRADLNVAFQEAVGVLEMRIEERQASITREPLPIVWGEERQLALVFQNILSNSLKYCAKEVRPRIHVGVRAENGETVVTIRDNGLGFEPRHAERIFGLFKRLHKDGYPGTGLGLAICRRVIERYGGKIWAESEGVGRGASVHFSLRSWVP